MQKKLCLLILMLTSTAIFAQAKLDEQKLSKKLMAIQEATKAVGFSVAIVKGNQVIYSKGFGYKDLENKLAVDENTLFAIGSSTKAFTTGLLGIMEDENGLSFKESPRKYLPELEFYNDDLNNNVTILDMISHRTGLPRHDFSWYLFPTDNKDSLLARVKYQEPFAGIRERWYYNNFMYLAQGLITEKLTGKSWEDNIRERFFKPLNMTTSNLSIAELKNQSNISKGYDLENFETNVLLPYYNIAAVSPAGSINSSAKEMANWLKVWLNDGKYNDAQVLPKKYIERAMNPLMLIGGIEDKQFPDQHLSTYGYAWFISSYKGHYRLEHGGNIDGFSANVAFFPSDSIGIVVLSNQNGSALPTLVRNTISDEILNLKRTDWASYYTEKISQTKSQVEAQKKKEAESPSTNSKPSHSLVEYTGTYHHKGYGSFVIEFKNDSLWAKFPRETAYLSHNNYDVFSPFMVKDGIVSKEDGFGMKFNFQTNDLGDIESVKLKFEPTLDPLVFLRSPQEVAISEESLSKYVGNYLLSGMKLTVSIKKESLMLLVPGQPEYTLLPVKENEFILKGLSGFKAEFQEKEGSMKMVLHQPNGTFTAEKE